MSQRNYALDGLKFILAVFVVFIHQKTPYTTCLLPLLKSAVPAFLMISGYCIYTTDNLEVRCVKAIKHMLKLCTWSIGFYALLRLFLVCIGREVSFMHCSIGMVYAVFFNNDIQFAYHLWYLLAYVYVLVIVLYAFKWRKEHYLYIVVPLLFLVGFLCEKVFIDNWFFTGLPYFVTGLMLAKYRNLFSNITPNTIIMSFLVAVALSFSLGAIVSEFNRICVALVAFTLVCSAISIGRVYTNETVLSEMGAKYSLLIYVFHPFCGIIITIIDETFALGIKKVPFLYLYPIVSLLMTMVLSYMIVHTGLNKILK